MAARAVQKTWNEQAWALFASAWRHAAMARSRGVAVAAFGLALGLALASYHAGDASFDVASDGPPANLLGRTGANVADLLLQCLGLASWVLAALPLTLGVLRAASVWPDETRWLLRRRALIGVAGVGCLAGGLAGLAPPAMWPLATGLGGLMGDAEAAGLTRLAAAVHLPLVSWAGETLLALSGVVLCALALGLRASHVSELFRGRPAVARSLSRRAAAPAVAVRAVKQASPTASQPASAPEPAAAPLAIRAPKAAPKASARETRESQPSLPFAAENGFQLPELAMLAKPKPRSAAFDETALRQNAQVLEGVLAEFGVKGQIDQIRPGPVVTLYELVPAPGVKSARVVALSDDIARSMSVAACRVSVVSGRNAIGVELPNAKRETVFLRDLLASAEYEKQGPILPLALGETIGGEPYIADLSRMPHLLIAGTTGSGKSVGVNAMILSILYRLPPDKCRFIMIDPKMLELSAYDGIPHLLAPVVTDPKKAIVALKWTVREMEDRYRTMHKIGVRSIAGYNERAEEAAAKAEHFVRTVQTGFDEAGRPIYEDERIEPKPLPYLVVVIDEVADLMMVAGKDIEGAVQRLAQMARAAGIHLIMATQRPSVDVITGTIKANFPTRISFQVTSKIDARTILGEQGSEQLLGQGDMLYMAGGGRITRLHGPFVSDGEVETVARFLRQQGAPSYLEAVTAAPDEDEDGGGEFLGEGGGNDLYDQAVAVVTRDRKASTSYIQRRLQIGYNRAASLMERMEREGVVGAANHAGKREILAGPPPL
ncbi:MAG TPA: DNA translocase FtsK 4TM domain-containing protein [Caulobacteraceae bacterium]|nr:DNA translocase FtsK 4TM domain-containing protein [Caulobacteraceae bacterium]